MKWTVSIAIAVAMATSASAQDLKLMDFKDLDPAMLKDVLGAWDVQDVKGKKHCGVTLKRETTIGGFQIDVAKDCGKTFPVMNDITAWRLYEGWTIGFADATRKLRIRFFTPDNRYVAEPETDGIFTIVKK